MRGMRVPVHSNTLPRNLRIVPVVTWPRFMCMNPLN